MKKFLVSVGNVHAYNVQTGELLFESKTMLDNTIDISTSGQDIRAGQGNSLQYIYNHSGKMEVTLTEAQFSLAMIAANAGGSLGTGSNFYTEESVTLGAGGTGTVLGTPLVASVSTGSIIYGWVTDAKGNTSKVTFTGSNFTLAGGVAGDKVTVRYYEYNNANKYVEVSSNIVPSVIRVVIDAQLASDEAGNGMLGTIQIEIPRLKLEGSQNISLKSDGYSQTPLKGMALAYTNLNGKDIYATITEIINSRNWYDDVIALAVVDDTITVTVGGTQTLDVRAVPLNGTAFKPPYADLTFTSNDVTKATISSAGVVTGVATGNTYVNVSITAKNSIIANAQTTIS